jgi:ankyrin repeat protein
MMDAASKNLSLPPYPRFGEIYRLIALAFDTKAKNREIDRLAREGDLDWSLLPSLTKEIIFIPLEKYGLDKECLGLIKAFITNLHSNYLGLVSTIQVDGLSRSELFPLLVENYFVPQVELLIFDIHQKLGGPELMQLLNSTIHPIAIVFQWVDKDGGKALAKAAYPSSTDSDKVNQEKVLRWEQGKQLPDLSSIKLFLDALSKSQGHNQKILKLRRWLLIARAIAYLEQTAKPIPVRDIVRHHIWLNFPPIDIGRILSLAVLRAGKRMEPLKMPALMLKEHLKRTTPKTGGDQAKTLAELTELEKLITQFDPDGNTLFHLEWLKGRWNVLSGNLEEALPHYEQAVELALYRAGEDQKQIIEEAFVLAAKLGKKSLLKKLKHWSIAFGLFTSPTTDEVIEDWEIEEIKRKFLFVFPKSGCFIEAETKNHVKDELPFLLIDKNEFDKKKADLRTPDRIFTIRFADEQTKRWTQLCCFTFFGRTEEVAALLKKGASVDKLDASGASALLCAIQYAERTGQRETLDILLKYAHAKETLNSITTKKQLTPLFCAIDYGEPDVVEELLNMGAAVDLKATVDNQTPLYYCLGKLIEHKLTPEQILQKTNRESLRNSPHVRESLRRYGILATDIFGDNAGMQASLNNPRHRQIFESLIPVMFKSDPAKQILIAELLLKYQANPNMRHDYPMPGRTPLMLTAEMNSIAAFDLLMKYGGNPYQPDAENLDCFGIARGFGSRDIVTYLLQQKQVGF